MILFQLNVNFEDVFICVEGERVREKEVKWRVERHHIKPSTHRTYLRKESVKFPQLPSVLFTVANVIIV